MSNFIGGQSGGLQQCFSSFHTEQDEIIMGRKAGVLRERHITDITITPEHNRVRYYHYEYTDGSTAYLFVNEGTQTYHGTVQTADGGRAYNNRTFNGKAYYYNAWENCLEYADFNNYELHITLEPLKSKILILDHTVSALEEVESDLKEDLDTVIHANDEEDDKKTASGKPALENRWQRSICRSIEYPAFQEQEQIALPDTLAVLEPEFSGFVRYENSFTAELRKRYILEITDAHEGVEVFVNKKSLGIQIVPPCRYELSQAVKEGENELVIEVATTLDREMAKQPGMFGQKIEPAALSGITGEVNLYVR